MTTIEEARRKGDERRKAEEANPLLKLGLGQLVMEMQRIANVDSIVLAIPENRINEVPEHSLDNFRRYYEILRELDRREKEYQPYKPEPRY